MLLLLLSVAMLFGFFKNLNTCASDSSKVVLCLFVESEESKQLSCSALLEVKGVGFGCFLRVGSMEMEVLGLWS